MLEIVDVPVNGRETGYVAGAYKKGSWLVRSGTWTQAQIDALPAAQKNKAGFPQTGSVRFQLAYPGGGFSFPSDKIYFEPEGADDDNDTYLAGDAVVGYTRGGTFRTNEFTNLTANAVYGTKLRLSVTGTLTEETAVNTITANTVALVKALNTTNAKAKDHRLEFVIVNDALNNA